MGNKKTSANTERMYSYAKGGGLNGFRNGGGVLDQKQLGGLVKAGVKAVKKIVPKIKKVISDLSGTTVDKDLLKNTGYARKVDLENAIKRRKTNTTGSN